MVLNEPVFTGLRDPFYAVDSRDYQVIQPNLEVIKKWVQKFCVSRKNAGMCPMSGLSVGIRYNEYMIGTQFHPEADASGMAMYLDREDKRK